VPYCPPTDCFFGDFIHWANSHFRYPDNEDLINKYKESEEWKTYRHQLIHDIVRLKKKEGLRPGEEKSEVKCECLHSLPKTSGGGGGTTTVLPQINTVSTPQIKKSPSTAPYKNLSPRTQYGSDGGRRRSSLTVSVLRNAYGS